MSIRDNLGGGSAGSVLDTLEEIEANTEEGKPAGALAVKELNDRLQTVRTYVGSDGKLHFVDASGADSVLPFSSGINVNAELLVNVDKLLNVTKYDSNEYSGTLKGNSTYYYEANFVIGEKNGSWSLTVPNDAKITKLRENIVEGYSYDISYKIETTNSGSWKQTTNGRNYSSFVFKMAGFRNDLV